MIFQKINSISILLASIVTLLTFGLCSAAHIEVTKIPSHIKSCDTEKDDVNQCMASAIKIMLSQAGNGIPEINVPPLEPYEIKKASYLFFNNLLKGKIQIKNVKAFGVTAADIQKVQFNQNKTDMNFSMKVFIPKLQIGGLYRAQVNVNNFTLSAKGDFNVTLVDLNVKTKTESEVYVKNNHEYLRAKRFLVDPTVTNMTVQATGLVDDPALNDVLVDFINQNWRHVYKSIIVDTQNTWEPELLKITNEFFSHLPLDIMFPRDEFL